MTTSYSKRTRLDLAAIRARLGGARGKGYWRSLEELAGSEEWQEFLDHELATFAFDWMDGVSRRRFLQLMGASLALAGLGGCGSAAPAPTNEKIVPYVKQPEEIIPGKPLFFATAMPLAGFVSGVLVESHEGRPTKIEGNPDHPASLGATDAFAQASILTMYDPDRSQVVARAGRISTWSAFFNEVDLALQAQQAGRGAGLRILTETVTSPTLAHQLQALLARFPSARWHQYEPAGRDAARAGARLAFGEAIHTYYRVDKADVILALDAEFLASGPGSVRYARDFAGGRRVRTGHAEMNRLYAIESTPSVTGAMADHRLAVRPSDIDSVTRAIAQELGVPVQPAAPVTLNASQARWVAALARDLIHHRGSSLVVPGDQQPPAVHALAHAMNRALGNAGQTVIYTDPVEADPVDQVESLRELVRDIEAGRVAILVIIGGNPAFTAPADLRFADSLSKVALRVHLSLYEDETSALCHWQIPEAHYLEAWSDGRAYDGTVSIIQPLIAPLYGGKTAHEVIAALMEGPDTSAYDIVRDYWKSRTNVKDFELFWQTALHDGLIAGTACPPKSVALKQGSGTQAPSNTAQRAVPPVPRSHEAKSLEIIFRPDPTIFDGRFANNGWLQELPKPLTKLAWDNAALMSPATAERLGLSYRIGWTGGEHGTVYADLIELHYRGRMMRAPAWIVPGHADDCVTIHYGYGRTKAGKVGSGAGFNVYAIMTSDAPLGAPGLAINKTGEQYPLACTQFHHSIEGRHLARAGTIEQYLKHPAFAQEVEPEPPQQLSLYPGFQYDGYAWGMAIDLNACTGCGVCVVACQAENNSPIVGKAEVRRGREMHWLRIDRYYQGGPDNPQTVHQPVLCMHCENAPCELVCPVGATNHSAEGLNDMVYNRCVGTRYCSNNCPYKVRRFNFLQYSDFTAPSLKLLRNPNVTVRSRGVMEKCTYCMQRINAARIAAEKDDRQIRDGEIATACQAACPSQAIVFGNINDPDSRVSTLKAESLNYGLLTGLNTRPRTTYLAKLRNPNAEIESE
ncbi:MAG: molybdopterin oxidoreductase [Candidatus Methylomirabilota bacterium]|nr:MAG: molybdopterin oxidoreductase [candidate division NC10 bacterium]